MDIFVDLDGTICETEGTDYEHAVPYIGAQKKLRRMEYLGHKVYIWTARGTSSGKDYTELTKRQLKEWGIPYVGLIFGKPVFDMYICDKSYNAADWRHGALDEMILEGRG